MSKKVIFYLLSTLFYVALCTSVFAQQVDGIEYFWNTDPGLGNGTYVAFETPSEVVVSNIDFSTAGLLTGRHILYTRAKSTDGNYGITKSKEIYLVSELLEAEYFWDQDPGLGNGTPFDISVAQGLADGCEKLSTTGLSAGIHYLYFRTKSVDGKWSITRSQLVQLTNASPAGGCPGDFTYDGQITTSDLLSLLGAFGTTDNCFIDLNGDNDVNISDMLIFLGSFGGVCM
ncbi:MAG: hypothetical protein SGI87_13480 [Flavobacteriales bacterium]|nr:hypothetical protein [Flavobacteriales bacterium]